MNKELATNLIKESKSMTNVCIKLFGYKNKFYMNKLNNFCKQNNINQISFEKVKFEKLECPICKTKFTPQNKRRKYCSLKCANQVIRGNALKQKNLPDNKVNYRTLCFRYHTKKCIICDETKSLDVHHLDENRDNNLINNLLPFCCNHHRYMHNKKWKQEILPKVEFYLKEFIHEKSNSIDA